MENGHHAPKVSWVERIADLVVGMVIAYPTIIGLLTIATTLLEKSLLLAGIFLLAWLAALSLYGWLIVRKFSQRNTIEKQNKEAVHDTAV